jgi:hypothetical protein
MKRSEPLSQVRLLLNAEPFGFGPASAIAAFFPYLRKRFAVIGYMGKGHTLDLQKNLPYDAIHDLSGLSAAQERREIRKRLKSYDLVLSALDFSFAAEVKAANVPVILYDPLAWYWKRFPPQAKGASLYLAQDFIGVRQRLKRSSLNWKIVSPIIAKQQVGKRDIVLVNLGGLQNPFLSNELLARYARAVVEAIIKKEPGAVIATSDAIAHSIGHGARSYSREEMMRLLKHAKRAYMTPGLGNIYDAAAYRIPTCWLPPANDSQGRQLSLLRQEGYIDAALDWQELGIPINYKASQPAVMQRIAAACERVDAGMIARLPGIPRKSKAAKLLERFGADGAKQVAEKVHAYALKMEGS